MLMKSCTNWYKHLEFKISFETENLKFEFKMAPFSFTQTLALFELILHRLCMLVFYAFTRFHNILAKAAFTLNWGSINFIFSENLTAQKFIGLISGALLGQTTACPRPIQLG